MNKAEIRAAEQDCARLITGYCQAADCDDVEAFVALFTTDAKWSSPTGSTVHGHDEMREYFAARPGNVVSAHICSNILVEVTGANSAAGRSLSTVYRNAAVDGAPAVLAPPLAIAENWDEFALTEQGWRIRHRRSRILFASR
ncbi:nuclear transport factor 2 family protein [Pseudonocardia sp. Cha107L01]|uniref:nuclear transport factor 2 family protein n=1 Tax=Pseudonocardia sp. Cha107L01 TaxID=3457576 RepID=UPI00403EDEB7